MEILLAAIIFVLLAILLFYSLYLHTHRLRVTYLKTTLDNGKVLEVNFQHKKGEITKLYHKF